MLAIKLNDGKEEWYILPGGGQGGEEILPQTVEREVEEEVGVKVKCEDLLFVIEGVHVESFHRIDLVFLCDYLGKAVNANLHSDTNQIGFDCLDLSVLNSLSLYPYKIIPTMILMKHLLYCLIGVRMRCQKCDKKEQSF